MNAKQFARFLMRGTFSLNELAEIIHKRDLDMYIQGIDKGTLLEQWRVLKVKEANDRIKQKHLNEFINQIEDHVHSEDEEKQEATA